MAKGEIFNLQPVRKRRLENWIDGWLEYTETLPSPALWRRWGGIMLIAGVLERKVFTKTGIGPLYPNLYVILVGPPGLGKTAITNEVWHMWNDLTEAGDTNGFHLASSSLTSASIIDDLREANRRIFQPGSDIITFNSLAICSNELGVLLPDYDNSFMSKLTDIYDGHPYSERRRTKELNFKIEHPQLNMIAATTPSYLNNILPEGAWEQGFLSRTLLVFSSESLRRSIFSETKRREDLRNDLLADLRIIFNTTGKMKWEEDAVQAIENWAAAGAPPLPEHPKLLHYNTRRVAHLLKLCMIASMSAGDSLVITLDHYKKAMDWLIELEVYMPDIFKSMVVGGDLRAMEDCWYNTLQIYAREQKEVSEARIAEFLGARIPAFNVPRVLALMVQVGMLIEQVGDGPGKWYKPRPRKLNT